VKIIEQPMTLKRLLADIDRFCEHYDISEAQLGKEAIKSHPAIRRWRDGKLVPKLDTVERLYAWMMRHEEQERRKTLLQLLDLQD
jgi:predicted transcriptional regulator